MRNEPDEQRMRRVFVAAWTVVVALKLAIAAFLPPFVDEAFYWQEGRHLALAYSDLPGLTAWLARLGTTVLGTTTAAADGSWSITSSTLADGNHSLTVTQTDIAGNTSVVSAALSVKIDTQAAQLAAPDLDVASDSGTSSLATIVAFCLSGTCSSSRCAGTG